MDNYTTKSTSLNSARIVEPVVIEETGTTRKVLVVDLNDAKRDKGETVGITIVHQRRKRKDEWEDIKSIALSSLKGGEGVKLKLDSSTTKKLYEELAKFYALVEKEGIQFGTKEFTVSKADEIISVSKDRKIIIERLLSENFAEEVWEELVSSDPDLATNLSFARVHADRSKALETFKQNLDINNSDESFWQDFFMKNDWIFGYGLNYQFLNIINGQPNYGGTNFTGKGAQKGDYLTHTQADAGFTVLVEIKTPSTRLLAYDKRGNNYEVRTDTWLLSSHLLGSVTQIQVNSRTWNKKSQDKENAKVLEVENIYTVEPKGILVIGNLEEFQKHEGKLSSFEIFRRNLHNPEVITFDELFKRAQFIVENKSNMQNEIIEDDDDGLPF